MYTSPPISSILNHFFHNQNDTFPFETILFNISRSNWMDYFRLQQLTGIHLLLRVVSNWKFDIGISIIGIIDCIVQKTAKFSFNIEYQSLCSIFIFLVSFYKRNIITFQCGIFSNGETILF